MTTLKCDHRMNLPCNAITELMMIICVLIYVISYFIRIYKLLKPSACIFYIISASIDVMYTQAVVWLGLYCI